MLDMLRRGEIDMLTSALKSPEREKEFAYSYPIGMKSILINARIDDNRFMTNDFNNFNGMTIGLLEGYNMNEDVARFAKENKFTFKAKYYSDEDDLTAALAKGEVDAVATSSLRKAHHEKTIAAFDSDFFYAIVQHSDSALLQSINNAIVQMNENEDDWQKTLFFDNYVDLVDDNIVFTPEEQEYIKAHSTDENAVVIATDRMWKPFSYIEEGTLKGIIPDYWKEAFALTGMKYKYVLFDEDDSQSNYMVECGADIYFGTSMTPSVAEKNNLLVSPPFMTSSVAMLFSRNTRNIRKIGLCEITPYLTRVCPLQIKLSTSLAISISMTSYPNQPLYSTLEPNPLLRCNV